MATQVLIAHTGQRLQVDTTQFSALDEFKAWIARSTSIPAHQVVALTSQGRHVKLQSLQQETEIYVYDIRVSSPTSPGTASSQKFEVPLPKRYSVPTAPNYIGNVRVLSEWHALYKERQAWALGIVDDAARLAAQVQERYSEMDVMFKCLDAAVTNLEISIKQIDPKYKELKSWVEPSLEEYEQLAESWERCLAIARNVPVSAAMVRFMTSRDLKNKQATLEDLIDLDTARKSGKLAPTSFRKFRTKATELDKSAQKMDGALDKLFGEMDSLIARSALSRSGEAAQLLQDIEALAKKIDTDYSSLLEYNDTQANVLQASRTAENHTSRLIPSLKKRIAEMDDMLQYAAQARNSIAADSVDFMRNITGITTLHSSVKNQIAMLNQAEDIMTTFDYLRLIHQLPYMYASFASEAIRRREWSDKIKTDSSTLANEMALFQDEESKRRRKWQKMVGSMYGRENLDANILGLEVNLLGEEEPWPSMVKRDLEEFLEHLQRQQAEVSIIEDVTKLVNELSSPTKQQSKRLKAFKNGSVHETALGRSGLMIRGDDDLLRSLQDDKSKLENKLKTSESRVRRLEDLLHRQSQASRPGIGGLFGHERNDSTNSIKDTASAEDNRRSSGNSEALLQRIQQLEGELNAEKAKSAAIEKDLNARATQHDEVKAQMEDANATKKELLENMEALQKEFVEERKSLENEIKGLKARLEETEDDIENFGESRENEKATYIERMHEMESEIERLQKDQKGEALKIQGQVEFLRNEVRLQREQNESLEKQLQAANEEGKDLSKNLSFTQKTADSQFRALRDIHDQLSPNDDTTEDLNDLIEALVYRATDVAAKLKTLENDRSILKADLDQAEEHVKTLKIEMTETKDRLAAEEETSRHIKENLDEEKARVSALEKEAAESREQLDQLRAQIADGETGSESLRRKLDEEEERISNITEELASKQSQVGSLEEELRLYKEKLQNSQAKLSTVGGHFESRSEKTKDLTQRLYSQNDRLCRLLERLGFSVSRQDATMTIQKVPRSERGTMSQIHNANDSSDPGQSMIRRSGMLTSRNLADSTDLDLLYWMNGTDSDVESDKYEAFMTKLGSFDMDLFAETVYRRVKDVEHLARKLQRDARSYREKAHTLQRDSHEKIAFKSFKEGDLALFLPTRNQTAGAWAAFNVGFPHYFLRETDAHRLRSREWLVARITRIQERVVDLSKSLHKQLPDTDSVNGEEDDNPFQLSDGLRWYLIDAHEDKPGAPATPGLGKSTTAANNVEAMADMHTHAQANGKDKQRASTNSIEGVSKALSKSLESRRSSSNSKKAIPFAVGAGGVALLKGNALGSETNSLRAVAPETPTGTSPPQGGLLGPANGHDQGQASIRPPQTEGQSVQAGDERPRSPEKARSPLRLQRRRSVESPTKNAVVWDSLWSVDLSFESGGGSPNKRR